MGAACVRHVWGRIHVAAAAAAVGHNGVRSLVCANCEELSCSWGRVRAGTCSKSLTSCRSASSRLTRSLRSHSRQWVTAGASTEVSMLHACQVAPCPQAHRERHGGSIPIKMGIEPVELTKPVSSAGDSIQMTRRSTNEAKVQEVVCTPKASSPGPAPTHGTIEASATLARKAAVHGLWTGSGRR